METCYFKNYCKIFSSLLFRFEIFVSPSMPNANQSSAATVCSVARTQAELKRL